MPQTISTFTKRIPPSVAGGGTLQALMDRQKAAALAREKATTMEQPIQSIWQGVGHLGNVVSAGIREGRAQNQENAARAELARIKAGVNFDTGATPQQLADIGLIDPNLEEQFRSEAVAARRAATEREQKLLDLRETRAYEDTREGRIDLREQGQEAAVDAREQAQAEQVRLAEEKAAREGRQVRVVSGDEAKALGYDGSRTWELPVQGGPAKDITVEKPEAQSPSGKLEKDIAAGVYGDVNDPKVAAYVQQLRDKEATKTGANVNRADVWKQQDAYINSSAALADLQEAAGLLDQGINWGWGSGAKTALAKQGIVGDKDLANRTDRFNKIMSREAIEVMAKTLAGADSDKDMQRFLFILNDENADPIVRGQALKGLIAKTRSHQELQRNRIIEGGGEVPAQPLAATGGNEASELSEAQAAIDKGADAAMVRKRFADKGFDPSKLKDKAGY